MKILFYFCIFSVPFAIQGTGLPENAPIASYPADLESISKLESEILANYSKIPRLSSTFPFELSETGKIKPVEVKISSYVSDIGKLERVDSGLYHWTAELIFRQKWNDKRLAYNPGKNSAFSHIYLNQVTDQRAIWKPDTYFINAVKGDFHWVTAPNSLIWVYPNGNVLHSARLTLTLRCHRPEEDSPKGQELLEKELVCPFQIASWGYTADKLVLSWEGETPMQLNDKLFVPHYTVKVTTEQIEDETKNWKWSGLDANFTFTPKMDHTLLTD